MQKGPHIAILSILILLAVAALMTSGDTSDLPDDRFMCDECHDDFEPFGISIDVPSEVPEGEPFPFRISVRNDGDHIVQDTAAIISLDPESGLVLEGGEPWTYEQDQSGSVGRGQSQDIGVEVGYGALEARFRLDMSVGLLAYVSLTVIGADGGHWAAGGRGASFQSITLDTDDLIEGGSGLYTVIVNHEQGIRPVSFDLSIEIDYGPSLGIQEGPDLSPGETHTFSFDVMGVTKGEGRAVLAVEGTAFYEHNEGQHDDRLYHEEGTVIIEVGDEFVGSNGGDEGGGGSASLLSAGQALGFISAILLVGSLVTSGHLPNLPHRTKPHCLLSKALAGVFILHWLILWVGPYGSVLGGIGTGTVMLILIVMLALGGSKPELLDGRVMGWSNRLLHRNMTYALVIILVAHILLNGSHFAFVRGG